ncbi:MAG TPA: hypothetical protein PKO15_00970 [Fibrobacteria bacterium]|nr:hypothetical protein [Fibrobacteria bacterium]HOX52029.1 hypothetical protein [Fibrobacteria bacterium]
MSIRKPLSILAAICFAALQGCETNQATAPGDRSSEGVGAVSFRLSEGNVNYLRADVLYLQYYVTGPGMDTIRQSTQLDTTPVLMGGIPCGTRIIQVDAVNPLGEITWTGTDTVEIYHNQTAQAHVVLHRIPRKGGVLIDITLDSLSLGDTTAIILDTLWSTIHDTGWAWYSYDRCDNPVLGASGHGMIRCEHVLVVPIPGDTTWVDTIVRRSYDTAGWCQTTQIDSTIMRADYRCYRPKYVPYTYSDTVWQDTTVGTISLNDSSWCHPSVWSYDSTMYCFTGKYKKLPTGTCEWIFYGNGFPQGVLYNCADTANARRPRSDP